MQESREDRKRSDLAKPYSVEDVELLQQALNDGDKTYAGIIAATDQPGAIGDQGGTGVDRKALRYLLNDCMQAKLVWTERRNGKDYFVYDERGVGLDWAHVLNVQRIREPSHE